MITLKEVVTGFERPVAIVDADDGVAGLYVAERGGLIKKVNRGEILDSTFLDVSDRLGSCTGYCEERGLLGLVFHPDYASNGYFFINYTSEDSNGVLRTIISRFSKVPGGDVGDASSEEILLSFEQPYSNQ